MVDIVDLTKELDKFNRETIPKLDALLEKFRAGIFAELNATLDRLDGAEVILKVRIPNRRQKI